jgi:NADH-quinone oxidoreductase subunit N
VPKDPTTAQSVPTFATAESSLTPTTRSLAFYVLANFDRTSEFTTEAGLKYFIFGSIISCFLLLGFSLIYLSFGATFFELLFSLSLLKNQSMLFLGITFVLISFLFKIGSAPFH